MKNKTAVEYLLFELSAKMHTPEKWAEIVKKAKAMEREQHFESYRLGNSFSDANTLDFKDYFEQYYKDTYGN